MSVSSEPGDGARLLCLGNDLLADDAFGSLVAERARQILPTSVDVVFTTEAGLPLLDHVQGISHLVVIDTILTGRVEPGSIHIFRDTDVQTTPGNSPHYTGLFEAIALGRALGLQVPSEVVIIAVEAADCTTIGGVMHPAVTAAIPLVLERVQKFLPTVDT